MGKLKSLGGLWGGMDQAQEQRALRRQDISSNAQDVKFERSNGRNYSTKVKEANLIGAGQTPHVEQHAMQRDGTKKFSAFEIDE